MIIDLICDLVVNIFPQVAEANPIPKETFEWI